jgi:hypothetical protein
MSIDAKRIDQKPVAGFVIDIQGQIQDRAVLPAEVGYDGFPVLKVNNAYHNKIVRGGTGIGVRFKADVERLRKRVIKT